MSKRFGRTQKNKMRARIAELDQANKELGEVAKNLYQLAGERKYIIDAIDERIRQYAQYSALLPPKQQVLQAVSEAGFNIAKIKPLDLFALGDVPVTEHEMHSIRMEVLDILCRRDDFADMLHTSVRFGNKHEWRYAVSMQALKAGVTDEHLIAKKIAEEFIYALRSKKY